MSSSCYHLLQHVADNPWNTIGLQWYREPSGKCITEVRMTWGTKILFVYSRLDDSTLLLMPASVSPVGVHEANMACN